MVDAAWRTAQCTSSGWRSGVTLMTEAINHPALDGREDLDEGDERRVCQCWIRRGVQPSAQALGGGREDADQQSTIQHSTNGKDWTKATSGGFSGNWWKRRGVQPSAQALGGGRERH
jgi:hypothetical protein